MRPGFLVLALGELFRLALLTLLVSDRFYPETNGPAGMAAWLLLLLSPHAIVATGLVILALGRSGTRAALGTLLPAKVLAVFSGLAALISEIFTGAQGAVRLTFLDVAVPDRLILAALYVWDTAVLVILLRILLRRWALRRAALASAPPPPPPRPVLSVEDIESPGKTPT